jgi:glycerol-3-phosphate dehydrogenase
MAGAYGKALSVDTEDRMSVGDAGRNTAATDGLTALAAADLDMLVVGGGITGVCLALEATRRGLAVGLVERDDFGAGATANCLKIVHGGLRYLQHLDLRRVRQSVLERSVWLRSAPHLVEPLPVVVPTYRGRFPSRPMLAAALALNEAFSADRNRGLLPERMIPRSRVLSRSACLDLEPSLYSPDLTGGVLFYDALMYSPERLTLEVLAAARLGGAVTANHVEFRAPLMEAGRVAGAHLRDRLTGDEAVVRTRWIVNATGSAVPALAARMAPASSERFPGYSMALNLVTRRPAPRVAFAAASNVGLGEGEARGRGRQLFVVPWRGQMMIGTAHLEYRGDPTEWTVTPEHVDLFLADLRTARPSLRLDPDDIALVHGGLLPLSGSAARPSVRLLKRHRIIDHSSDGCPGAVSVVTVKLTTARRVASDVLDRIAPADAREPAAAAPLVPLPGGTFPSLEQLQSESKGRYGALLPDDVLEHLVRTYGARYAAVLEQHRNEPGWNERVVPGAPVVRAQLTHGVVAEHGRTVDDLIWRRTELGPRGLATDAAHRAAEQVLAAVPRPVGQARTTATT